MPSKKIGQFEVLDEFREGGMGEVYGARDTQLQRTVASRSVGWDPQPVLKIGIQVADAPSALTRSAWFTATSNP
jgi:hypothetical protein